MNSNSPLLVSSETNLNPRSQFLLINRIHVLFLMVHISSTDEIGHWESIRMGLTCSICNTGDNESWCGAYCPCINSSGKENNTTAETVVTMESDKDESLIDTNTHRLLLGRESTRKNFKNVKYSSFFSSHDKISSNSGCDYHEDPHVYSPLSNAAIDKNIILQNFSNNEQHLRSNADYANNLNEGAHDYYNNVSTLRLRLEGRNRSWRTLWF